MIKASITAEVPATEEMARAILRKLREIPGVFDVAVTFDGRRAPVQGNRGYVHAGTVAWDVHMQAWDNYAACGHGSQSADRMAERGGFSYQEIQCALAGHYNRTGACGQTHPPVPTFEPQQNRSRR